MDSVTKTASLTINGQRLRVDGDVTVLDAARSAGIYVPALCNYRGLKPLPGEVPDMACQLCVVEIDGGLALSCDAMVVEGMTVDTEAPAAYEARRRALSEMMRRHPSACLVCSDRQRCRPSDVCPHSVPVEQRCVLCAENGICELQKAIEMIGINGLPPYTHKKLPIREDSPVFLRDHNLCILCERCVRVCDQIRGARAIEWAFPCYRDCPAGIDIPRYLRMIGRGRPSASLAVIREKVPFPGVLGRVCIHPCEQVCQRGLQVDKPLQIRMVKRFAADNGDDSWKKQSKRLPPTGRSVAVIGAGPAGLTAAYYLAKQGHQVTVFEALSRPGGAMLIGIPEYRLPRNVLDSEIEEIMNVGVEMKLNTRITAIDPLLKPAGAFDAVFLGLGAHQGIKLGVEGEDAPGVIEAVDFLRHSNLGERIDVGKKVGVVGGGNVAIDAARIALRFGAEKVTIFYRRTRPEMPATPEEVEAAMKEGVEMNFLTAPFMITRDGNILKVGCRRMKLGEPDASGRPRPVEIPGSEFITELDTLIGAIGQRPDVPEYMNIETGRGNTVKVSADMQTTHKGVFSAGDCVTGPASVIEAIGGAKKAASAIDRYLGGDGDISERLVPPEEATNWLKQDTVPEKHAPTSYLPPGVSKARFDEVERPWDHETAMAEANRCLKCYVITPPNDKVLQDANCQFCGACVDACPTGALAERSLQVMDSCDRSVTTICPYCGVGCQLKVEIKGNAIFRVVPDPKGPANKGQACVKGKFGLDFIFDPARLKTPLIKKDVRLVETSWDEALDMVARQLARYKPEEVAVITSAKNTNEDNYVAQKFTRAVIGTNTIDHCARLCHSPTVAGLAISFGSGAMTNSIHEIGEAECILAIGTNTTEAHPVIGLEPVRAMRNGKKLIIADPREIKLSKFATLWLRQKPGTDVALLMGMAKAIVDEGLADAAFVANRCENFEAFKESLKAFDLDAVSKITGVPAADIAAAARLYATNKPATILYSVGITQSTHGTDNVLAVANLAMLTGNIGKPSTGVNPLRGQNNVQGACDMGGLPNVYSGYQPVTDPAIKRKFEAAWGHTPDTKAGLTLPEIFEAIHKGQIKALYIIGENPALTDPDSMHIRSALEKLEFLACQDIFLNDTTEYADVVLSAASFAEKDGTFTNTERRVQRVRKIIEPVGDARPDWWITCQIAKRMGGKGFDYESPSAIMDEVARLTPSYGGISFERLDKGSLQWPCPTKEHPGTPILHTQIFSRGKGRFMPLEYKPPQELPDADYPLVLTTKRSLYHYHTGTMTHKVGGLNALLGEGLVEINPLDATTLSVKDGDIVKVVSRRGEVTAKARISGLTPAGVVSMDFHFPEVPTNTLTNPARDSISRIPEYKVAAVRVEKK